MAALAPYKYNPAEMPPEDMEATFIGRDPLLDRLLSAVREQAEGRTIQHYLLLGPRGIGKTTLLLMLKRRIDSDPSLSSRWLCVRYREEEFYVHTVRDLLALALENLCAEENVREARSILAEAEAQTDDERSLATILSGLRRISDSQGKRILLLIDNFDQVFPKRIGAEAGQHALRKLLSTDHFIMVIGTSVQVFEDIAAYDEAFFNFFSPIHVDNLTDEQIQELLSARARLDDNKSFLRGYKENKEKVRAITFLTGGNPRLVLMLYDILSRKQFLPVVQTLRETIDNLTPLLKDVLQDLPAQQSKVLDALMRLGGVASPTEIATRARLPLNAVSTQLGRLKEARFVEALGEGRGKPGTHRVQDQMFRTWYQMRYLRPARRRVEMFVEFLRAWFSVEERMVSLDELQAELHTLLDAGSHHRAREVVLGMEYLAASFEESAKRAGHLDSVAEAYLAIGDLREAALIMADVQPQVAESQTKYEALGYAALGLKLQSREDLQRAVESYTQAIKRDNCNVGARLGLGTCFSIMGEHEKALEEYTALLGVEGIDVWTHAAALFNRSNAKHELGDIKGAIADCTAITELEDAPIEILASTLSLRAQAKSELDDVKGAIADFTAVIELRDAPMEVLTGAYYNRGVAKRDLGDLEDAIADLTAVARLENAPIEILALALGNRGLVKRWFRDLEGALKDFTAAIELKDAPGDTVTRTLYNRGLAKREIGDIEGAVADFTAVSESEDAPIEALALALNNRGMARGELGDIEGAIADFSAVTELENVPVEPLALALNNRGLAHGARGDIENAITDFTAVIALENVPIHLLARALNNRGLARRERDDVEGAVADFNAVIGLGDAPSDTLAEAFNRRGLGRREIGDIEGAIADFTAVIEMEDAPTKMRARALGFRGMAERDLGDNEGAIADFSAVTELQSVPIDLLAWVFNGRGMAKHALGDLDGAIADHTAVTNLADTPTEETARALNSRALTRGESGDVEGAIADFTAVIELENLPDEQVAVAFLGRGASKRRIRDTEGAIADLDRSIEIRADVSMAALEALVTLLCQENRIDEAVLRVARLGEVESEETSTEQQLDARIEIVTEIAQKCSLDSAAYLLDTILETSDEELRSRLVFLKPALEFASTSEELVLAKLPVEEQEIAKRIAEKISQTRNQE